MSAPTNRKFGLLATVATIGLIASPAFAQGATATVAADEAAAGDEEIVVTGSLIKNPNLERSAPVTVTSADEIELSQSNVAEEILRELPGVVPSIGSAVNNGNAGSSFVDLRGLGSFRNIVLLDGNRIAPSSLVGRVDLNNIPLALVERVEVLTGGASTTYGADAISGVVNFLTKQNFSGIDLAVSEQITEQGDGNTFRADVTIGGNFDDSRGNAVLSLGYQEADPVFQGARPFSVFNVDGIAAAPAAAGSTTSVPAAFTRPGSARQQIDPTTGTLVAPFAPFNFNPFNLFQTPFERFNVFGQAHYDVADNFQIYTRALFSKNSVKTILAPGGSFGEPVTINVSNPFLPVAARNQFCAANGISVAACAAAALVVNPNDPAYRTFVTAVSRRTTELGPRLSTYTTQIFDYRIGAKFDITDAISLDVNGSYGESENNRVVDGNLRSSRLREAALASNATTCIGGPAGCVPVNLFGADGSITAPMAAYLTGQTSVLNRTSLAQGRGVLAGDFGMSSPWASDPIGFAAGTEYRKYVASQAADALSQIPGEISGAGGASPNIAGGYDVWEGFGELIAPIAQDKPGFKNLTVEAGIRYSSYKVAAPTSPSYKTTTYKAGGSWEPFDGLKFRGNYSHAVRAPNIAELFAPQQTALTAINSDPCSSIDAAGVRQNAAPSGNLLAVCLAQGATPANVSLISPPTAGQGNSTQGGNLNLKPETSNSYTFGAVIQPRNLVENLSITIDYYNIKITNGIGTPTTGDALTACFGGVTPATAMVNAGSAASLACTVIRRNPLTGGLDGSAATTPGLLLALTNLSKLKTDGIDLAINYSRDLGFAKLGLNFQGNYTRSSKNQASPSAINRECTGFYSNNCTSIQPEFYWTMRTTLGFKNNLDLSLVWRHIDGNNYEPIAGAIFRGAVPLQPGGAANPINGQTVDFSVIPAANYFDLTGRLAINEHLSLTLTVQNLFDKQPPIVGANLGLSAFNSGNTYPSSYDALGRRYALAARLKF